MKKHYLLLFILILILHLGYAQQMPLDFSTSDDNFSVFGGSGFSIQSGPIDGSNSSGQFFNDGSDPNQGFFIDLTQAVNFDNQKDITLRFYQFDPNSHTVLLKFENGSNPDVQIKQTINSPAANQWKDMTFDFSNAFLRH